jgi:hypothetical protein
LLVAWGDRFYSKLQPKVEQRLGEQVEVLGVGSRCGAMNAVIAGTALRGAESVVGSPIIAGAKVPAGRLGTSAGGKDVRLPMSFVVALTPTSVHVLKWRKTWLGTKVKKELGAIPRDGLQLEVSDHGVVKRFVLAHPDGVALAFEMTRMKWTTSFAEQMTAALA